MSSGKRKAAEEAFRQQLKHRVLTNQLSAKESHIDFKVAEAAGAQGAQDLLSTAPGKNSKRDLLNKLLKSNEWPGLYWAKIPLCDLKTGGEKLTWVPFLLPHEWVPMYANQRSALEDLQVQDPELQDRLTALGQQLKTPFLVPLGLHGDGVPIGGNMTPDSLDVFNLTLISSAKHSHVRVPFVTMQLKHMQPQATFDAIVEVLCWSLRCLASGTKPTSRHDGSPWLSSDKHRAVSPEQGASLGVQAVLAEIRADWVFLQKLLKFPAWNTLDGLCWLCTCTHSNMLTVDTAAAHWRFERLLPGQFLEWCRKQGRPVSQLFSLPGVCPEIIFPDWMHSADMGVTQDFEGQVFAECLPSFPGRSRDEQCKGLWAYVQAWYKSEKVKADRRMQSLHVNDFVRKEQPNKLRSKAAHAAALVPMLPGLCRDKLPDTPRSRVVVATAEALLACYQLLPVAPCAGLAAASRKFANSYCALMLLDGDGPGHNWHVKPKLHLFQELCEFSARCPRDFWCYQDETFGNVCAKAQARRGGPDSPGHNTAVVLQTWCANTPFLRP